MSTKLQIIAGSVSLTALLAYTLVHTGGLLATYVAPWQVGYIAAFGIELAVVSLSLRIGDLKRSGQDFRFFMFVLVSVVVVSALANISQGFAVAHKAEMTLANISQLDAIQAIIGLTATGLISLIVLALSEIIGVDVNAVVRETERQRKNEQKRAEIDSPKTQIQTVREMAVEQARDTKSDRIQAILNTYRDNPDAKPVEVYRRLDIPRPTFYAYLNELVEDGIISKNGNGVKVIQ